MQRSGGRQLCEAGREGGRGGGGGEEISRRKKYPMKTGTRPSCKECIMQLKNNVRPMSRMMIVTVCDL